MPATPDHRRARDDRAEGAKQEAVGRLARLALVVLVASGLSPLVSQVLPGQAYVIASDSMEPTIPKGSLVLVRESPVEVGDAAAYHSVEGTVQVHRVTDVVRRDGQRYLEFEGDANAAADSYLVTPDDVVGPVEATAPLIGYAWLMSSHHQILIFAGLLAFYLSVTAWDARDVLVRARLKGSALLIALLVVAPGALAAVVPVYPRSYGGTDAQDPATLKWDPGPLGTATVGATNATATATVEEPKLWKETVLWGCTPGGDCLHTPTGSSYASVDGSLVRVDASEYAPAPTFFLEAYLEAPSGGEIFVRLHDASSGAAVAGSELSTTATSPSLVRSSGFTLSGTSDYTFQTKVTGASGGNVTGVKLLAMQPRPEDTVTRPKIASASTTSSTLVWEVPSGAGMWQDDGTAMDGVTAAHLEFVAHVGDGLTDKSHVRLVDNSTGSVVTTIDVPKTATSPTLFRSADLSSSLTAGRDYQVEYQMGSGDLDDKLNLHIARIVLEQDGFSETVQYTDLSWATSSGSTSYSSVGYPGRYHMDDQWDSRTTYFEATLADDTLATTAYARLYDNRAGAAVSGSEQTVLGTSRTRLRSGPLSLNAANVTYDVQVKTGASLTHALLDNAWIVTHVEVAEPRTRDSSRDANHGQLQNQPSAVAAKHGDGYQLDGSTQQIRVPDDAALRPSQQMTAMLWYRSTDNAGSHRILDKSSTDPAGYLLEIDGAGNALEAKVTVGSSRKTVSTTLPGADAWHHVAVTYNGSEVALYLNGSRKDRVAASGDLTQTTKALFAGLAQGEATTLSTTLPSALDEASVAWNGSVAYIFGGETPSGLTADILKYDPGAGTVSTMSATLPTARKGTSTVWADGVAYVFGGKDANGRLKEIVKFDPATDSVTTMSGTLPVERQETSAVWNGTHAFVFGGKQAGSEGVGPFSNKIVRYDPGADATTNMTATLPSGRDKTAAFYTGGYAYVLGGQEQGGPLSQIVRYDPGADTRTILDAVLPEAVKDAPIAWTGSEAYLLGGCAGDCPTDRVFRFTPSAGTATTAANRLPTSRRESVAVWHAGAAYVLGGDDGSSRLDDVAKWVPGASRFQGTLDELRIYDTALSSSQIADVMDKPYESAGTASTDPADDPRRLGGEALLLQMDADDHMRPMNAKLLDHVLETANTGSNCTWDLHLTETSSSGLSRIDRAIVSIDDGQATTDQIRVRTGALTMSSGSAVAVAPGSSLQYVVEYVPRSSGSTTIETDLVGSCQEGGIDVRQSVTWELG